MSLPPNRIREARESQGISLREVARRIDADPTGLRHIERSHHNLTHEWMRRIAAGLAIKPADLLPEEDVGWQVRDDEAELLTLWRKLRPTEAANLLAIAKVLAKDNSDTAATNTLQEDAGHAGQPT